MTDASAGFTPLGHFVKLQRGHDLPAPNRRPGTVPILGSFGITGWHDTAKGSGPGLVIGRSGASIGVATYCDGPFWPLNTTLYVTDFLGNDPKFAYFVLDAIDFSDYNSGSAQPSLNRNHLSAIQIWRAPLPEQRRIASILSAYDDLIENNTHRIQILEEMAQAIYREWFVEFRFPGHEDVQIVDSELGPIPGGWRALPLSEVCTRMQSGSTPPRDESEWWEHGDIDWYTTTELRDGFLVASQETISQRALQQKRARLFEAGTVLMAIYGRSIGRLGVLISQSSCNQAALGMVANREFISQPHLYWYLRALRDHFFAIAQGAAQQNISKEKVASARILVPAQPVSQAFGELVDPLWKLQRNLTVATQNLRLTRDLLLPRLISGEIDVSNLDIGNAEPAA
jgi:type I restriction enzyme S subunit